jgi:DNA-binding CsgD family transcriptional regulator
MDGVGEGVWLNGGRSVMDADERDLLERSAHLAVLDESLDGVLAGLGGRLVLVGGEAGAGKTSLLQRWCAKPRGGARVVWGTCEPLLTPGPLVPLFDVAEVTGGELGELVAGGALPREVAGALIRELQGRVPTVLVLEDLHWADEATLDVLRMLGRRLRAVRALVLASYRDDQLARTHPLRLVLGELGSERGVSRLDVSPLSAVAVEKLCEPHGFDAAELHRRTAGNPFFVTEVLAGGGERIPPTVRDAVLARAARLSVAARELLDVVAVTPPQAEVWLLEALAGKDVERLEECLASGMLTALPGGVAFRHELARVAVEEALIPDRRIALHRRALAALTNPPNGVRDLARLAHHAEGAEDGQAVLRLAPAAAERAASLGAHREAAAQYARALRFAARTPIELHADLLERRAEECNLTDQSAEAIDAAQQALEYRRQAGDRRKEGELLRLLSVLLWCPGRVAESDRAGAEALTVLEVFAPGRELALAYGDAACRCLDADDGDGVVAWGTRALELAERLGETEPVVRALIWIGSNELLAGRREGLEKLQRAIVLAEAAGLEDRVASAHLNVVRSATLTRVHTLAEQHAAAGLAYCSERGLDLHRRYLLAYRARLELDQGRWSQASASAERVLGEPSASALLRILALVVLALVRARRRDPEVRVLLAEALTLAERAGQLQGLAAVAAARAEAAWLTNDHGSIAHATQSALELALRQRSPWTIGELACWRRRAGIHEAIPETVAAPWAAQLENTSRRAAKLWSELGCPYEAALALAETDDEHALREALDELQALQAAPAAAIVARRLRERGVRALPRGPRRATQRNPAGLSARELEVLELLAAGLRNAEIARRLFISEKTAGHHVSAILRKLAVTSRTEAGAAAARLGLTAPTP